jgi:hypothetical protein
MDVLGWPVFLLDGGDVAVIVGPSSVQRDLEAFLAERRVEFYDAAGKRLRLVAERKRARAPLRLEVESDAVHEQRLRSAITAYLRAVGQQVPDAGDFAAFSTARVHLGSRRPFACMFSKEWYPLGYTAGTRIGRSRPCRPRQKSRRAMAGDERDALALVAERHSMGVRKVAPAAVLAIRRCRGHRENDVGPEVLIRADL